MLIFSPPILSLDLGGRIQQSPHMQACPHQERNPTADMSTLIFATRLCSAIAVLHAEILCNDKGSCACSTFKTSDLNSSHCPGASKKQSRSMMQAQEFNRSCEGQCIRLTSHQTMGASAGPPSLLRTMHELAPGAFLGVGWPFLLLSIHTEFST